MAELDSVDYKSTVNPQLCNAHHAIPRIEEILHKLRGARHFCKLDLFQAYLHIPMDDESSNIQVISTHIGTIWVNRLARGIKTAPSIFHSILDQILGKLTGVTAYFDDIIIYGTKLDKCHKNLISCLEALQKNNLHLNRHKCIFFTGKNHIFGLCYRI